MSDIGLTTHVLDAVKGGGAADVKITLFRLDNEEPTWVCSAVTRPNGRAELLDESALMPGEYEITFAIGAYFRAADERLATPGFFDDVVVRFVIPDGSRHYHVPLIASPWTYSTYRGGLPPKGE